MPAPYDLLSRLSSRRREVIAPVFENPRRYVLSTVRALAEELGSDPATTLRIVRRMGFPRYREFQHYLHELSIARATPLERWQVLGERNETADQIDEALRVDARNVEALRKSLDVERLIGLARELAEAERVLLFGGDLAISLVHYLAYHLSVFGLSCLKATTPGEAEHLARTTGPGDLVIGLSFGRGLRQTVEALAVARENGARCVGFTDTLVSPLTRYADEVFLTPRSSVAVGESYVPPIALINALLVAFSTIDPGRMTALLESAAEQQRTGYRWYRDE